MRQFREIGAILSGILRIMHPDQYRLAVETVAAISSLQRVGSTLKSWPTIFSVITVVANRASPMHREQRGDFHLFDILLSVGSYTVAPITLQPLGIQMKNSPGTLCGVSGKFCRHGIGFADGARIGYALYMRPEIYRFAGVYPCGWSTQDTYKKFMGGKSPTKGFVYKRSLDPL